MGIVYRARHAQLGRQVAIKMVLAGSHASPETKQRFLNEVEAIAALRHPSIVQVFELGEHDGVPYYVMEFIDGPTLERRLADDPPNYRQAALWVEQLADAMECAHSQGIVHRDLKPSNVLLADGELPKIADFGIAKRRGADQHLTATGAILGTPGYLAPEQAGSGSSDAIGPPADIFSLGVILYELLTGHRPFDGTSEMEVLHKIVRSDPPSPAWYRPGVPRDLETITLKCLQKSPARRYRTAGELRDDLRRHAAGNVIQARRTPRIERWWKWARRHPGWAALGASIALIVAGSIGGLWWHTTRLGAELDRTERLASQASGFSEWVVQQHLLELRTQRGSVAVRHALALKVQQYLDRAAGEVERDATIVNRLASAYENLADVLGNPHEANLGQSDQAAANYDRAIELLTDSRVDADDEGVRLALVRCLVKRADVTWPTDGLPKAQTFVDRAAEICDSLDARSAAAAREGRARLLETQIALHLASQRAEAAAGAADELDQLLASPGDDELVEGQTIVLDNARGEIAMLRDELAVAAEHFGAARDRARQALDRQPLNSWYQRRYVGQLATLADVEAESGQSGVAADRYREALRGFRQLALADPTSAPAQRDVVSVLSRWAGAVSATIPDQAETLAREAVTLAETFATDESTSIENQRSLATALLTLGEILAHQNKLDEARQTLQRQLERSVPLAERPDPLVADWERVGRAYAAAASVAARQWSAAQEAGTTTDETARNQAQELIVKAKNAYAEMAKIAALTPRQERRRAALDELLTEVAPATAEDDQH
jgi:tetratricopeptide (TPR) repeat protein